VKDHFGERFFRVKYKPRAIRTTNPVSRTRSAKSASSVMEGIPARKSPGAAVYQSQASIAAAAATSMTRKSLFIRASFPARGRSAPVVLVTDVPHARENENSSEEDETREPDVRKDEMVPKTVLSLRSLRQADS